MDLRFASTDQDTVFQCWRGRHCGFSARAYPLVSSAPSKATFGFDELLISLIGIESSPFFFSPVEYLTELPQLFHHGVWRHTSQTFAIRRTLLHRAHTPHFSFHVLFFFFIPKTRHVKQADLVHNRTFQIRNQLGPLLTWHVTVLSRFETVTSRFRNMDPLNCNRPGPLPCWTNLERLKTSSNRQKSCKSTVGSCWINLKILKKLKRLPVYKRFRADLYLSELWLVTRPAHKANGSNCNRVKWF